MEGTSPEYEVRQSPSVTVTPDPDDPRVETRPPQGGVVRPGTTYVLPLGTPPQVRCASAVPRVSRPVTTADRDRSPRPEGRCVP